MADKSVKIEIIKDASVLEKLWVELSGDIRALDGRIHQYLLSEIVHIEEHRNITRLNKFFSAIKGSGARVSAMHAFVQTFGNFRFVKQGDQEKVTEKDGTEWRKIYDMKSIRKQFKFWDARRKVDGKTVPGYVMCKTKEILFAAAASRPWWEFRPEPEARDFTFDMGKQFINLIASTLTAMDKMASLPEKKQAEVKVNRELLADLADLGKKYGIDLTGSVPKDFQNLKEDDLKVVHLADFRPKDETNGNGETSVDPVAAARRPGRPAKAKA